MVRYLASDFFDERPVVLNRFFDRPSNATTEQTTFTSVPGKRLWNADGNPAALPQRAATVARRSPPGP